MGKKPTLKERLALARDSGTPAHILTALANDPSIQVRRYVASNRNTPPEALSRLVNNRNRYIREGVAQNPNTPPEALSRLVDSPNLSVRGLVARNPNTPPEALSRLANNRSHLIRVLVARNPNTPPEALSRLANNRNRYIRKGVAQNSNTPPEALMRLARDPDSYTRYLAVCNPNMTLEALSQLANNPDQYVREGVVRNPKTPPEVLAKLTRAVIVDLVEGRRTKAVQAVVPDIGPVTIFVDDSLRARPVDPGLLSSRYIIDGIISHEQGVLAVKHFIGTPAGEPIPEERLEQLILAVQFAAPEIPQPLMMPIESEGIEFVEEKVSVPVTSEGEELPEEPEPEAKPLGTVRLVALVDPFDVFNSQTGLLSYKLKDTDLIRFVFGDPVPMTPEIKQKLQTIPKLPKDRVPESGVPHVETNGSYVYALWYPFREWEWKRE